MLPRLLLLMNALYMSCILSTAVGFAPTQHVVSHSANSAKRAAYQMKSMSNIFEDMGKFFDGLGKNKVQADFDVPELEDIDGEYVGSKRLITIPGEHTGR